MNYDDHIASDPNDQPAKDAAWERVQERLQAEVDIEKASMCDTYRAQAKHEHERIYGEGAECDWEPEI